MGLAFNLVQRGVDWLVLASLAIRLPTTVWKRFPPPDPIQIEGGGDHAAGVLEGIRNGAHATEGSYLLVEMALQTVACSQMTNPIPFLRRPLPLLSLSAAPVQTPSTLDPHPLTTPSQKKYICMEFQASVRFVSMWDSLRGLRSRIDLSFTSGGVRLMLSSIRRGFTCLRKFASSFEPSLDVPMNRSGSRTWRNRRARSWGSQIIASDLGIAWGI
uniref:Uncharacterized protein LOC105059083 isoform X3 n=1 Tax=Elaeis guineensis var. tenera TaxID=51953 RepID=A0A6J0PC83_ELAGV|nr:uncharacterized protein LOC105059083 isoform X3 [Elaeis guineensis]